MSNSETPFFNLPPYILIIAGILLSFLITFMGIPSVVKIAKIKNLYDIPGGRNSHNKPTPRLGGTMIFAGFILSSVLFTGMVKAFELKYIIAGLLVLFFIGLKDDIITLVPAKKALGQFIAAFIMVILGGVRISFGNSLNESTEINYIISITLSLILVITLINSINFVDGIDGLASGVGIIASISFGIWFIINDQESLSIMCFSLTGSLLAFSWYNIFGKEYKIFLGDTGSMVIGFLLSVFLIRFLDLNLNGPVLCKTEVYPSLTLAILIVPVFDVCRIVIVRIIHGKSPFNGDNNHIHHKVLQLSGNHLKATTVILLVNIIIINLILIFRSLGNAILMSFLFILCIALSIFLTLFTKDHIQTNKNGLL